MPLTEAELESAVNDVKSFNDLPSIAEILSAKREIRALKRMNADVIPADSREITDSVEAAYAQILGEGDAGIERLVAPIRDRLQLLKKRVAERLVGREEMLDCILASLITGIPIAIFGPPGTAKSACVRMISEATATKQSTPYFEWLVTAHTMPEELFGPPSLARLKKDEFVRTTTGRLPEAEFAFLDEVFRGGGHILNTLLSLINERKFHNGEEVMDVPLLGVIAAANTPPSDPDVDAFFDRFPVRVWVDSIFEDLPHSKKVHEQAELLHEHSLAYDAEMLLKMTSEPRPKIACTNDFRIARMILSEKKPGGPGQISRQSNDRFIEYVDVYHKLRVRHELSDRAFGMLYRFGCALDWLDGNNMNGCLREGSQGHINVFRYIAATSGGSDALNRIVREELVGLPQTEAV